MIYRETLGNDLEIAASKGTLSRQRPTMIQAAGNQADFTITGGFGYVPVTIAGLTDSREPVLEVRDGDTWKVVDQAVHGRDFWQCDVDPQTRTCQVTYSVGSDTPEDKRVPRRYRFSCGGPSRSHSETAGNRVSNGDSASMPSADSGARVIMRTDALSR